MNGCIILAAGSGSRMQADRNKQYLQLQGRSVLSYSLQTMAAAARIDAILLVIKPGEEAAAREALREAGVAPETVPLVHGGDTRAASVHLALQAMPDSWTRVLIHDGARPLVDEALVNRVLDAVAPGVGVVPGLAVRDTIKRIDEKQQVVGTVPRTDLVAVQTPQGFYTTDICAAHQAAPALTEAITDDASLFEALGRTVRMVAGQEDNIKVTVPQDLALATFYLTQRGEAADAHRLRI